jgi:multisubunit Na+/H+ antiporter MnhE subunit
MLLGSILLALAWAALQGDITLTNLLVGMDLAPSSSRFWRKAA